MSTTTERPSIDVEGLAGMASYEVADALGTTLALALDWCEEGGYPLNSLQTSELVKAAILGSSNVEATIARQIIDEAERAGVEVGEFPFELERILGRNGA
jgi:hypothetical protein